MCFSRGRRPRQRDRNAERASNEFREWARGMGIATGLGRWRVLGDEMRDPGSGGCLIIAGVIPEDIGRTE